MEAKSNGTPPAARIASHASRANAPSSALHGVTRPSVEATPTNGFDKSASLTPSACRNARCGARSRPSTVTRDGRMGTTFLLRVVLLVLIHDFFDVRAVGEAERDRALRRGGLGRGVDGLLQRRVGLEAHFAAAAGGVAHLLGGDRDAVQQDGALRAEPLPRQVQGADEGLDRAPQRDAGEARIRPHGTDVVAAG